jgi:hypothetical protein
LFEEPLTLVVVEIQRRFWTPPDIDVSGKYDR